MVSWYEAATLIWCFFPCRKAVGNISFFFILLVFQVSFSFLDDAIVAEDDTGSDKKKHYKTITLQKLNKKIYLGAPITVKISDHRTLQLTEQIHLHLQNHGKNLMQNFLNRGQSISGHSN